MKRTIFKPINILVILLQFFMMTSCSDMFINPLKDKETGEKLTLLLLDPNFFTTTMTVSVVDAETGADLGLEAKLYAGGLNGNDVVDFTGQKGNMVEFTYDENNKETFYEFNTSSGTLELALDPAIVPTEGNPVELSFKAEVEGYQSTTSFEKFSTSGNKTVYIEMLKIPKAEDMVENSSTNSSFNEAGDSIVISFNSENSALKSITEIERPYMIYATIATQDFLKFKDTSGNYIFSSEADLQQKFNEYKEAFCLITLASFYFNHSSYKRVDNNDLFVTIYEALTIQKINLAGKEIGSFNGAEVSTSIEWRKNGTKPEYFGFWNISSTNFTGYSYNFKEPFEFAHTAYGDKYISSDLGATINFICEGAPDMGFDISMELINASNKVVGNKTFRGKFNKSFLFENVPSENVTLNFDKNNFFAFKPIPEKSNINLVTGDINVTVYPADGYELYEITLEAICPGGAGVGIAPTYNAYYVPKLQDVKENWQGLSMAGGVFRFLAKPDTDYRLYINVGGKLEYIDISTDLSKYASETPTDIEGTIITYNGRVNGIYKFKITHNFTQNICDNLGF